MKFLAVLKAVLQVVALTAVLLTWSSVGRFFEAVTTKTNSLHVWFGPPTTPKEIHIGEIYNVTIEWTSKLATRKTYLNVSMDLGLVCSSGSESARYKVDPLVVQTRAGKVFLDFPLTSEDLRPDVQGSLCHLNLAYSYWANTATPGEAKLIIEDNENSDVFKLVREPRLRPLPLANATILDPADRRLSWQLRVDEILSHAGTASVRSLTFKYPEVRQYFYTAVSIWPEDDPEWSMDQSISLFTWLKWVLALTLLYTVRVNERARAIAGSPWRKLAGWWGNDIEDPLAPRKTVRSRRRSILRDHIPMHGA
ncbi:hypothetical protein DFJ77DRAFT_538362 [Powellomyces hirtus]|nr:hypothetical protein DFJ77DRAFT_538362 [Powellomyces hirtus]